MRSLLLLVLALSVSPLAAQDDPSRILKDGDAIPDDRLGKAKTLNDYFPFTPPKTKSAWDTRREQLRQQLLVANGLWPMPEKTPLRPVIHGAIEREGYVVEKVYFASMPGHYVTGNLYRPTGKRDGKRPGVLCPHGHWANGRFFDAGEPNAQKQIEQGAEKFLAGARYPLQARCVHLARMGCVVFHYDMVGYADSTAIPHRQGFTDAKAELWGQNFMGLQTWNSIRSLDFIASLPDVDADRLAITGASGGGTQTFILGAIDDRPKVAFPAVMVSTAMQGGCICENCSYLRVGTGNIEIAALFAPKPLGMSGADDWTVAIETKGLPELKQLYRLLGVEDNVMAKCFPEFKHNFNQVSRELMYTWFKEHLFDERLDGSVPVRESDFEPIPPKELSVFDTGPNAAHPRPDDELNAAQLREQMTQRSREQLAKWKPTDADSLATLRDVVGPALRAMTGGLPRTGSVKVKRVEPVDGPNGIKFHKAIIERDDGTTILGLGLIPPKYNGSSVIWIEPEGKAALFSEGELKPAIAKLLANGTAILAPDIYDVGELKRSEPIEVDGRYAGYTYGYNPPPLASRVHDILTAVRFVKDIVQSERIDLVGQGEAGPWVALARAQCGDLITRTAIDLNQFRFDAIETTNDPMMLPGILQYGGMKSVLALIAPGSLFVHHQKGTNVREWLTSAYDVTEAKANLRNSPTSVELDGIVAWLTDD